MDSDSESVGASGRTAIPARSALVVKLTAGVLSSLGVDMDLVLSRIGLDLSELGSRSRIPLRVCHAMWDEAVRTSGDSALGVKSAHLIQPEAFDAIGYVVKNSEDLEGCVAAMSRYARVIGDGWQLELSREGGNAVLRLLPIAGIPDHPQITQAVLCVFALQSRALTQLTLQPHEVRLAHAEPKQVEALRDVLGQRLVFDAPYNELVFDAAYLALPLTGRDPALRTVLQGQAEHMLNSLPSGDAFLRRVRKIIRQNIRSRGMTAELVSRQLAMSERTFRRRLTAAGVQYQTLRDDVRFERTKELLMNSKTDITDVALEVGFSDTSGFARAFRRWTGSSTLDYRRTLRRSDAA